MAFEVESNATRSLLIGLSLSLLISLPAFAADPTPVHGGDRVTGDLPSAGAEAGFVIDVLEGTVLALKAKATDGSGLEPEILLYDPEDVRMQVGSRYRDGTRKAKLRRMPLPVTAQGTGVHVSYVERKPGPGVAVTQALTYPFVIIAVERRDGPVTFTGPNVVVYGP